MNGKPIIFSTLHYARLAAKIEAASLPCSFDRGLLERNTTRDGERDEDRPFKDGEHYHRLLSNVEDRQVVIVGGTIDDAETMELFDLGNACFDWGAAGIKFAIPFFGYSTMERAVKDGEAVKAKYRARLLSAIPQTPLGNRFYFLDLHAAGLQHYLEGRQARHIYAKPVIMSAANELAAALAPKPYRRKGKLIVRWLLGSTDAGRSKWVESLAKDLGVMPAFAFKHREMDETENQGTGGGSVRGRLVIIYDDMIRTGGSLLAAAEAYLAAGAIGVAVISTHGIFAGDSIARLQSSGLIKRIVVTDSMPGAERLAADFPDFLSVKTVAELFAARLV
jgi:ribose-phosphate pyrophosphokinase